MKTTIRTLIFLFILSGCNSLRYVPDDKYLLDEYRLEWNSESVRSSERRTIHRALEEALSPDPNGTFLGMRPGLWARLRTEQDKGKWITRYINKRFGERPVYVENISIERIKSILANRLENNGLFFYDIKTEWKKSGKKTKTLIISIHTSEPYRLNNYELDTIIQENGLQKAITACMQNTQLHEGSIFSLESLRKERNRLQDELREKGFYFINADHFVFEMDTVNTPGRTFNLYLQTRENMQARARVAYSINQVFVFTNYSDTTGGQEVVYRDLIFDRDNFFKPKHLRPMILLEPDSTFRLALQRRTARYLNSLRNYNHASMRFQVTEEDSSRLDMRILLTPANRRSFRAEVQALTRSNNFAGPALKLTYSNRNIFKGGETFRLSSNVSFETQLGDGFDGAYSYEVGLNGELDIPRLVFANPNRNFTTYGLPRTKINSGVNFLRRAGFYTLNTFSVRYGYIWQTSERVNHRFDALDIMFTNLLNTTDVFEEILDNNPFLRRSFERQFIPAIGYAYTYSEFQEGSKAFRWYANLHGETSGNILGTTSTLIGAEPQIFGLPFAQYLKGEIDGRMNARLAKDRYLVTRIFTGMGYSYGNSASLPFIKQYFSGGPNSIRAFRIRSLGPGGYINPDPRRAGAFFDQSGDIMLEANLEYRFPIASIVKGAWFLDAGNVWLLRDNPALPNGAFSSEFYNQLAIGGGFGVRFDINFFVIRFDFATPIRLHASEDDVWAIRQFNPLERSWYRDGLMVNFALGYPF
ncbi:MAG: BamA/TamA family outer membrane protein [Cryomorphaceae bacterium]|nr:BamA/TamA family outer membrane protein [Cryomorphaceae bacterium]